MQWFEWDEARRSFVLSDHLIHNGPVWFAPPSRVTLFIFWPLFNNQPLFLNNAFSIKSNSTPLKSIDNQTSMRLKGDIG